MIPTFTFPLLGMSSGVRGHHFLPGGSSEEFPGYQVKRLKSLPDSHLCIEGRMTGDFFFQPVASGLAKASRVGELNPRLGNKAQMLQRLAFQVMSAGTFGLQPRGCVQDLQSLVERVPLVIYLGEPQIRNSGTGIEIDGGFKTAFGFLGLLEPETNGAKLFVVEHQVRLDGNILRKLSLGRLVLTL